MKKVFVLAVIGAACSSVAFAGEVRQTKAPTPVVKTTIMSDAQMDKVTAGDAGGQDMGQGTPMGSVTTLQRECRRGILTIAVTRAPNS